jgi:nucleoside-diphosphate-sugar epimerase
MIKNLVIGSDGFIGNPFCEFLEKEKKETVIRFDLRNGQKEDARFAKLPLDQADRIYFLAWDVGGAKYLYDPNSQAFQLDWNLKLLHNVMPQLATANKPFLFVSSQLAEEYDTVYGVTKRLGEVWTRLIPAGVFIRQWNVYGPVEATSERSHVIADFIDQAIKTGEIRMLTTGEERRQFIHVHDVCEAWYLALAQNLKRIHDVTSFEWVQVIEVAKLIGGLTGAKVIPGEMIGSTPITPIKGKIPGWFPKISLEEGLKKMVEDAKKNF